MAYEEHRRLDLKALQVTDATIDGTREVWLGYDGQEEGQWLTPEHFREHVAALAKFAEGLPAIPTARTEPYWRKKT